MNDFPRLVNVILYLVADVYDYESFTPWMLYRWYSDDASALRLRLFVHELKQMRGLESLVLNSAILPRKHEWHLSIFLEMLPEDIRSVEVRLGPL